MAVYLFPFEAFALLAVLSQFNLVRIGPTAYALGILWIGLFAGLRLEVGQDWEAYEAYFNDIGPFDSWDTKFEFGYYLLNYVVKALGGSYSVVFLIASLFCAYSVFRLTSRFALNRFYILTIYMGYSYLILHFAQVRQSLAIGFFLLGIDYYLRHRNQSKLPALALMLIAPLFQISSLIYLAILVPVLMWQSGNAWWWAVIVAAGVGMGILVHSLDLYSLMALVGNSATQEKLAVYKEGQTEQGIFQVIYSAYLLALAFYFYRHSKAVPPEDVFVVRYAIVALVSTATFTIVLAGSYVFYSRTYAVACLFQGFAAAIVFSASKRNPLRDVVFAVTMTAAAISYCRLLIFYADTYTPYRLILESF
jgi:EpsG family